MSNDNILKFMKESSFHITNINQALKNAKSEILVDFICLNMASITVVTNKIAIQSDLYIIENYIKKVDNIDIINVDTPCLSQSKSYLKIIGIPYHPHNSSNKCLTPNNAEDIIKQNQIFDNVVLVSKPQVIKVLPKSDMSIIWIDIWDIQSGSKAKYLINRCFNIERYIATICEANMNPGILQCKNCWRWGHAIMSCHFQGSKYVKYNGSHKSENHQQFGWCCKVNKKTNPPHIKTKEGNLCPHSFKCLNCHGDH